MENLEILKGVVSDETYAAIEAETKDSKIKLMDLSSGQYVSEAKYKDLETQLERVNSALTDKTAEYDNLTQDAFAGSQTIRAAYAMRRRSFDGIFCKLKSNK